MMTTTTTTTTGAMSRTLELDYLKEDQRALLRRLLRRQKEISSDFLVDGPCLSLRLEMSRYLDFQLEERVGAWRFERNFCRALVKSHLRDLCLQEEELGRDRCLSLRFRANDAVDHAVKATYLGLKIEYAQTLLEERRDEILAGTIGEMFGEQ